MNIAQTRQILSYLWASHPGATRYTDDDKLRTIAAFFRVLHGFSAEDVLRAVDAVCEGKPTFIPSAYEVLAKCEKTVDINAFLPHEYISLMKALHIEETRRDALFLDYKKAWDERKEIADRYIISLLPDEQKTAIKERIKPLEDIIESYLDACDTCKELKKSMEDLYVTATFKAFDAYDARETALAQKDLKGISDDLKALGE